MQVVPTPSALPIPCPFEDLAMSNVGATDQQQSKSVPINLLLLKQAMGFGAVSLVQLLPVHASTSSSSHSGLDRVTSTLRAFLQLVCAVAILVRIEGGL